MYNYLSFIGLLLDIAGVVVLFFNGPPVSPILPNGSEFIWDSPRPDRKKIAQRKIGLSSFALILIIIGFLFQLAIPVHKIYTAEIDQKQDDKTHYENTDSQKPE